jgi:hypothetical protein
MAGYLIEYNRRTGDWKVQEFQGPTGHQDALRARLDKERSRIDADVEIASINGENLETVKKTHSRYFEGRELLSA